MKINKLIIVTLILINCCVSANDRDDKKWDNEINSWEVSEEVAVARINEKHGKYKHTTSNPSKRTYSWIMKRPYLKNTNRCLELTLNANLRTGAIFSGIVYNAKCEKIFKKYNITTFNKN